MSKVPRVSIDDFFLGTNASVKERNTARSFSTAQLRKKLKTAGLPAGGGRKEVMNRYDQFVKETLAEAGLPFPSESEESQEDEDAKDNPTLVMVDESTGNKYMRTVDQKGIGKSPMIKELKYVPMCDRSMKKRKLSQ